MSRFRSKRAEKKKRGEAERIGFSGDKDPGWVSPDLAQRGKDGQRPIVGRERLYTVLERGSSQIQANSLRKPANRLVRPKVI